MSEFTAPNILFQKRLLRLLAPIALFAFLLTLISPTVASADDTISGKISSIEFNVLDDDTSEYHGDDSTDNDIVPPYGKINTEISLVGNALKNVELILEIPEEVPAYFDSAALSTFNVASGVSGYTSDYERVDGSYKKIKVRISTENDGAGAQTIKFSDIIIAVGSKFAWGPSGMVYSFDEKDLGKKIQASVSVIDEDGEHPDKAETSELSIEGKLKTLIEFGASGNHSMNSYVDFEFVDGQGPVEALQTRFGTSFSQPLPSGEPGIIFDYPSVDFEYSLKLESKPFESNANAYTEVDLSDNDKPLFDLVFVQSNTSPASTLYVPEEIEPGRYRVEDFKLQNSSFSPSVVFHLNLEYFENENVRLSFYDETLDKDVYMSEFNNPIETNLVLNRTYNVGPSAPVLRRAAITALHLSGLDTTNTAISSRVYPGNNFWAGARQVLRSLVSPVLPEAALDTVENNSYYDFRSENEIYRLDEISVLKNWKTYNASDDETNILKQGDDYVVFITTDSDANINDAESASWESLVEFLENDGDPEDVVGVRIDYVSDQFKLEGTVQTYNNAIPASTFPALFYSIGRDSIPNEFGAKEFFVRASGVKTNDPARNDTAKKATQFLYGYSSYHSAQTYHVPSFDVLSGGPIGGALASIPAGETLLLTPNIRYLRTGAPIPAGTYLDYELRLPPTVLSFEFPETSEDYNSLLYYKNQSFTILDIEPRTTQTGYVVRVRVPMKAVEEGTTSNTLDWFPLAIQLQTSILYTGDTSLDFKILPNEQYSIGTSHQKNTVNMRLLNNTSAAFQVYPEIPFIERQDVNTLSWFLEWNNFTADSNGLSTFAIPVPKDSDLNDSHFTGTLSLISADITEPPLETDAFLEYTTDSFVSENDLYSETINWESLSDTSNLSEVTAVRVVVEDFKVQEEGRGQAKFEFLLEGGQIDDVVGLRSYSHFDRNNQTVKSVLPSFITLFGENDDTSDDGDDDGIGEGVTDDGDSQDGIDEGDTEGSTDGDADDTSEGVTEGGEVGDGDADNSGEDDPTGEADADTDGDGGDSEGDASEGVTEGGEVGDGDSDDSTDKGDSNDGDADDGTAEGIVDGESADEDPSEELADSGIGQSQRGTLALAASFLLFGVLAYQSMLMRRQKVSK